MQKAYIKTTAAALACALLLTACSGTNESNTPITLPERTTPTPTTTTTATTPPETTTAPKTTTAPITVEIESVVSELGIEEDYGIYTLSDEDEDYISELVFVGDSICRGYNVYGFIPDEHSLAHGNTAARSISEYTFDVDGRDMDYLCALYAKQPKYAVFSMGMNDINMTSKEVFCDNYRKILEASEKYCPNTYLIVLGITPISSTFSTNSEIDIYNAALEEMVKNAENEKWFFINAQSELKNANNDLKSLYSAGDGIHLAPDAYKAVLWYLCRNKIEYELGSEKLPSAPAGYSFAPKVTSAAETTAAPETTKQKTTTTQKETTAPKTTSAPKTTTEVPQTVPSEEPETEPATPVESSEQAPEEISVPEETSAPEVSETSAAGTYIELPVE